jgi:RNA 2',3'-cyclic 3'-phosphodiesterase
MKRLFCAIKIPPSNKLFEAMATYNEALAGDRIKWVDLQNLHLTLKFFGDTNLQMEQNIIRALQTAAQNTGAFSFDLEGCGSFGPPGSPRVLWIGASRAARLITLHEQVHKYLKPYGYEPDKKDYSPHLTLGRIKSIRDYNFFKQQLEVYKQTHFGHIKVDRFYLYQSILKAEGPEYKVQEEFMLS